MARLATRWAAGLAICVAQIATVVNGSFLPQDTEFWFWQTAVVAKSWLYIDGGEVWTFDSPSATASVANWNENTYAINLNTSWSTTTVKAQTNFKADGISVTRQPDAFYDAENDRIISLGGSAYVRGGSFLNLSPRVVVETFSTTQDDGSTPWEVVTVPGLKPVSMPAGSVKTTSDEVHYSIGGYTSFIDEGRYESRYAVQSMMEYNMTSKQFTNTTLPPIRHLYGGGEFVPFGKKGVVVSFGGMHNPNPNPTSQVIDSKWQSTSMSEISIFDVESRNFYTQKTRGDVFPAGRSSFCTVSAGQTGNGTYEIVVYGGVSKNMDGVEDSIYEDLKAVWILTLPAFTWVRSTAAISQRSQNNCAKLNDNLMISVGGWIQDPVDKSTNTMSGAPDPFPNGLGMLDLSSLEWVTEYKPDYPSVYSQPSIVQSVYAAADESAWTWDAPELKDIFINQQKAVATPSTTAAANPTATAAETEAPPPKEKSAIGAIVGGVVGGLAFLAALGLLIFCLKRRKSSAAGSASPNDAENAAHTYSGYATPNELESPQNGPRSEVHGTPATIKAEMWTEGNYHESAGSEVHEISSVTKAGGAQVFEADCGTPRGVVPGAVRYA